MRLRSTSHSSAYITWYVLHPVLFSRSFRSQVTACVRLCMRSGPVTSSDEIGSVRSSRTGKGGSRRRAGIGASGSLVWRAGRGSVCATETQKRAVDYRGLTVSMGEYRVGGEHWGVESTGERRKSHQRLWHTSDQLASRALFCTTTPHSLMHSTLVLRATSASSPALCLPLGLSTLRPASRIRCWTRRAGKHLERETHTATALMLAATRPR